MFWSNIVDKIYVDHQIVLIYVNLMFNIKLTQFDVKSKQINI